MYIQVTLEQIIMFHDFTLEQDGGLSGIKDYGHLEAIWDKPFHHYFGEELYPGLAYKAAIYLESIAQAHAFNDANKRTAVLVMLAFLSMNGRPLRCSEKELFDITIALVTRQIDIGIATNWIALNI
ncbi:type II toxin-antitoxin system death-on-curing family toxin [Paenibacillus roseipurpureus]|uniref:Type II toxin-antitoxin system death-on-curing family toxin n=1 Tax=Paenibacillus roseopurpureus TaxID=2918901 RepID=A0AA96LNT0_9BACL|nr:type II toxin-antitoxin system death-on-curing family toxin [Paenibacillus sp. MBLB1832]WNR44521.1 type II toxin-antitoxin system death-on-curing family toxin [Paenibacillus sp. MBLB1832]